MLSVRATASASAMSLEEFAALPDEAGKQELDGGELVKMAPVCFLHSRTRTVWIYGSGSAVRRLEGDAALSFPVILGDIFPAQPE